MPLQFLSDLNQLESEIASSFSLPADLTVAQAAQADLLTCAPDMPLREAAAAMQQRRCSSIVVMEGDRPIGIWTESDALRVDFAEPAQFDAPIRAVMSSPVESLPVNTRLRSAAALFRRDGLHHFLVVDPDGKPVGILSQTDVVVHQGIEHYLHLRTVGSVVRKDVPRLAAEEPLTAAVERMRRHSADAVLIRYPDGMHGILTERDLVRLIATEPAAGSVGDYASRPLYTVSAEASLYRVRGLLTERQIRHVGVLDGSELIGLVSFGEIMSGLELAYVRELQQALRVRDRALSVSRRSLFLAERIIESTLEGVIITDANGRIVSVNPAFTRLTGYTEAEVIGKTPGVLSSGRHGADFYEAMWRELREHGRWQGEIWNRKKNGELLPEFLSVNAITDESGRITHYAGMFNDISKLKEQEESIRNQAYRDPLTGLPNRRLLGDRLKMAIAHAHRHGGCVGLLFVDLDRFKQINDSLGHAAGDALLIEVARRLRHCVREDDTVARLGGDEFVVVLTDVDHRDAVRQTAERVREVLRAPLRLHNRDLVVTCSLGISIYPDDGVDPETLLQQADAAMYQIKKDGRDGLGTYAPAVAAEAGERLTIEIGLRKALTNGELQLHYQPLVDGAGRLAGAEALLRWWHPELGQVRPDVFVPLAEESGLIVPIGDFVLREAVRQLAQWRRAGMALPGVAVNVSGRQLRGPGFVDLVAAVLNEAGVPPELLTLELTESLLMDDAAAPTVRALKQLGVVLALDDFGTGYCAMMYLKRFSIDQLKIDRSFIDGMLDNEGDAAIVHTLIDLSRRLNLKAVAEGVETRQQLEMLRANGCSQFQGYLFAPPLPAETFEARYRQSAEASSPVCAGEG